MLYRNECILAMYITALARVGSTIAVPSFSNAEGAVVLEAAGALDPENAKLVRVSYPAHIPVELQQQLKCLQSLAYTTTETSQRLSLCAA